MAGSDFYGQGERTGDDDESWYRSLDRGSGRLQRERLKKPDMTPDIGREYDAAKDDLKVAEEGASSVGDGDNEAGGEGIPAAEEREKTRLYVPKSRGDSGIRSRMMKGSKGKGKVKGGKGFIGKKGPIALIIGLICGGGGLMMGVGGMMPFAIEEMIIEKFNSIGISSTMASDAWLNVQLNYSVRLQHVESGETGDLFAFSDYQVEQFRKQGIIVLDNNSGIGGTPVTRIAALLYKKGDSYIPVVGSDMLKYETYTEQDLINAIKLASGFSNIGKPISAAEALQDSAFKTPYTAASKAWRGGASGWFDGIMSNITEVKLSINRNRWTKYITGAINDATDVFKKAAESASLANTRDSGMFSQEGIPEVDGDGNPVFDGDNEVLDANSFEEIKKVEIDDEGASFEDLERIREINGNTESVDTSNTSVSASGALNNVGKVLNSKAVKAASAISDYGCALLAGLTSVYTVLSAYQSLQFLNLISGFLEAVDKVKAGGGDGSPLSEYSTNLVVSGETTNDSNEVVSNKSGMAAAGMAWLFSNSPISQSDPSVRNVNFETIMSESSGLFGNFATTMQVYEACGYVKAGTAAIDLATTIISFIPIFGQGVKAIQIGAKAVAKVAIKVAVQIALYAIIPIAAKNLTKMLIKNAATEWFGEDLGNAIVSGASKYLGGNGTSGGQSGASMGKLLTYKMEQDIVIAEEAEYQRAIKSPFDITSKYTFLGSLAYSLMPLAYSGSNMMSVVSGMSSLLSSSLVAISPTAGAVDAQSELSSVGSCNLLESTGAVGDAFCNPYIITDVSTINESPVAISQIVHRLGSGNGEIATTGGSVGVAESNFDADGKIASGSNLAKYAIYCGQRTSQYGIKDASITEQITGEDTTVSKILKYVPGVNNIQDIVQGTIEGVNMAWINGSACIASEDNAFWDSEYKYYQRYMENERLLENMNPGYESPVTELAKRYYEENPVDNSFEGQLARFSGMSKEDVSDAIALMEYYLFLNDYNASERYAFGAPAVEMSSGLLFDNDNGIAERFYVITLNNILYADVRNRSFAV